MPEDEWEEVEEQIPKIENEYLQAWIKEREDFIEKEKRLRSGMYAFSFPGHSVYGNGEEEREGLREWRRAKWQIGRWRDDAEMRVLMVWDATRAMA